MPVQPSCPLDVISANPLSSRWNEPELRERIIHFLERSEGCLALITNALTDESARDSLEGALNLALTPA